MTQFCNNDINLSRQYFTTNFRKYLLECNGEFHYFCQELSRLQTKYQTSESVKILETMSNNLQNLNRNGYELNRYISDCSIPNFNDMILLNELLHFIDPKSYMMDERISILERTVEELKTIISGLKNEHDFESIMKFIDKGIQEYNDTIVEDNVLYEKLKFKEQYNLVVGYILDYFRIYSEEQKKSCIGSFTTEQVKDYACSYLTYCPHTDLNELAKFL